MGRSMAESNRPSDRPAGVILRENTLSGIEMGILLPGSAFFCHY
jgi:hypothetical protein